MSDEILPRLPQFVCLDTSKISKKTDEILPDLPQFVCLDTSKISKKKEKQFYTQENLISNQKEIIEIMGNIFSSNKLKKIQEIKNKIGSVGKKNKNLIKWI